MQYYPNFSKNEDTVTGSLLYSACLFFHILLKFWKKKIGAPSDLVLFKAEFVQKGAMYILYPLYFSIF